MDKFTIPLSVPKNRVKEFRKNYRLITQKTGKLMLFAGDQKVEHLNQDFWGKNISPQDAHPKHLFDIAQHAPVGAFATQLGLISRYGRDYKNIPYIVKLNSKSNLLKNHIDPKSKAWYSVEKVAEFKQQSKLKIAGIGYTLYLGSEYENEMMTEAGNLIYQAHQHGLITILWMYPRGKYVKNETNIHTLAGAAGVANCLGSDFVKLKYPYNPKRKTNFKEVIQAAGNTQIICVGGKHKQPYDLFRQIREQTKQGTDGIAIGRNLHQRSLSEAIKMTRALNSLVLHNSSIKEANRIFHRQR